jgi:hypothetical protein
MTTSRTEPRFDKISGSRSDNKRVSWFQIVISLLIMYFFFSACLHLQLGTATIFDVIIMVIMVIWGILSISSDSTEVREGKQEWKRTSKSAEVAIVNRSFYGGGTYEDEYGIPHTSRSHYHLDLEMNADQRALLPNDTVVSVNVGNFVYEKLEKRNSVRIYYKPEAPLTFSLEEEL